MQLKSSKLETRSGGVVVIAMALGLSLAQCVEGIINDFVAMKVHFRYHANPVAKLKCFSNNCKLCQEEEEEEKNNNKHRSDFPGKRN
jgi:hypothetical protein